MQTQMTDIDMQESDTSDSILKKNKINKKKKSMCRKATPMCSYEALKWKIFLKIKKLKKEKKKSMWRRATATFNTHIQLNT